MDNTLEFRVFDKSMGLMFDSDCWVDCEGNYWDTPDTVYDTPNQEIVKKPEAVVMQYIGLRDKNGVKMFEGDVIRVQRGDWGVIVRNAPFFELTVSPTQSSLYTREFYEASEVIGNIYQNPELLNVA